MKLPIKKVLEYAANGIAVVITALDAYVEYQKFQKKTRKKLKKQRKEGRFDAR